MGAGGDGLSVHGSLLGGGTDAGRPRYPPPAPADEDDVETFLLATREEGAYGDLEAYSPNSPLGRALLDAKVGETREYELPNGGTMKVTLLKAEPFRG